MITLMVQELLWQGLQSDLQESRKLYQKQQNRQSSVNQPHTLNLLGVTPLDFGPQTNVDIMKKNLQKYGWEVVSSWAMGDTLENLSRTGEVEMNLVVSSVGLPAAKILREKFGTPYVIGSADLQKNLYRS